MFDSSSASSSRPVRNYGAVELNRPPTFLRSSRARPPTPRRSRKRPACYALLPLTVLFVVYSAFRPNLFLQLESNATCDGCLALLVPFKALAEAGDGPFVAVFTGICRILGQDADVCTGAVGGQAPILAHDLRQISTVSSNAAKLWCSSVLGACPLLAVNPYNVTLLAPVNPPAIKSARRERRKPFQVIHLSDVHIDRSYAVGSEAVCSKPLCCRDYGDTGGVVVPAGKFGNKRCDTPVHLIKSMLRAVDHFVPDPAFSIFTGDVVDGAVWQVNQTGVVDDLHLWNSLMRYKTYPVLGNHDVAPVNSFPRSTTTVANSSWVFDLSATDWEAWIGAEAAQQLVENSGCYAIVHPGTNLKIISLNTQYWYKANFWLYDSDKPQWNPNSVLSWMADELHSAETAGQKAWIIGHMPFGKLDALVDQSNYADQIFQRYQDTIVMLGFGHSHLDEIEIGYSDYSNRTADSANLVSYMAGAVTPRSGNPVFRVYDVDPDSYEVMDFTTYYTNVSLPSFDVEPVWTKYYSARDYGTLLDPPLQDDEALSPSFWHRVTELMEKDDKVFELYNTRLSRGGKVERCRGALCKAKVLCMLRSMRSENNCAVIAPGLSFGDKSHEPEETTPELEDDPLDTLHLPRYDCEGPGMGSLLKRMGAMTTTEMLAIQGVAVDALTAHQAARRR